MMASQTFDMKASVEIQICKYLEIEASCLSQIGQNSFMRYGRLLLISEML